MVPERQGYLHFIWTRQSPNWANMSDEDGAYWSSTIGNTFLAKIERRPKDISTWDDFKEEFLPHAADDEWQDTLNEVEDWNAAAVEELGGELARASGKVWYSE